jgi:DNA-binding transcriptional ArsR family regulator
MEQASQLASKLGDTLKLAVEVIQINDPSVLTILDAIGQILRRESENFQEIIVNVGSANKHLTCGGVTAAFVYGIKAFDVMGDQPLILPVMKFAYAQAIAYPKMQILYAIEKSGGDVESLEKLSALSNYGKPLLSYHIRGSEQGQGLEDLGLVDIERGKRGRLRVRLTDLGRTLLSASTVKNSASLL